MSKIDEHASFSLLFSTTASKVTRIKRELSESEDEGKL